MRGERKAGEETAQLVTGVYLRRAHSAPSPGSGRDSDARPRDRPLPPPAAAPRFPRAPPNEDVLQQEQKFKQQSRNDKNYPKSGPVFWKKSCRAGSRPLALCQPPRSGSPKHRRTRSGAEKGSVGAICEC